MLFTTPFDVELSVWMGVGGWGCPISTIMFLMYTASFVLMNSAPSSASAAGDMTALMICDMFTVAPFGGGVSSSFDRKNPSIMLLACGMLFQPASLCAASTMLFAWYVSTASSCDATQSKKCLVLFSVSLVDEL